MDTDAAEQVRMVIIGAGFAGLGMAVRLKQAGIDDFVILERAEDVGGTWRDNSYPGCAVDVQSHLYSFSFAPNPNWSQVYAPQSEIWAYIKDVCGAHGVMGHVRFGHEVTGGEWDEDPNYFMLVGPNTATGHTSILLYLEAQIEYIVQALAHVERTRARSLTVRPEVQAEFNQDIRDRLTRSVWTDGGCRSWYLDPDGGTSVLWPGYTWRFRKAVKTFDPTDYEFAVAPTAEPSAVAS